MTTISLCMIVKDEEEYLPQCLESVREIVDEIIIVDTGSADKTIEIARKFGARVLNFEWNNDTSAARNFGVKEAKSDWILVLDADEFISAREMESIRKVIDGDYDAVRIVQHNYVKDVNHGGFKSLVEGDPKYGKYVGWFPIPIIRLFRNKKGILFEGKMHELVDGSVEKSGGRILDSNIHVYHYGFVRGKNKEEEKKEHYHSLSKTSDEGDGRDFYNKGIASIKKGLLDEALVYLEKSHEMMPKNIQIAYVLGAVYLDKGEFDEAISVMDAAKNIDKNEAETFENQDCYSDLYSNLGAAYMKKGELKNAFLILKEGAKISKSPKIFNNLAAISMSMNNPNDALFYISNALKIAPNDVSLLNNFGSILVQAGRKEHAIEVYKRIMELDSENKDKWEKKLNALM